jgi:hypothetical protein
MSTGSMAYFGRIAKRFRGAIPALMFALVLAVTTSWAAAGDRLSISPSELRFEDAYARRQLLVSFSNKDVTHDCRYKTTNAAVITVDGQGYVIPVGPGQAQIVAYHDQQQVTVSAEVAAFESGRRIDFANEVVPVLTRFGCNSGGCHGKALGQNGFKLSLFGFDPVFDYDAIVLSGRGRRVFPAAPHESLLLLKGTATVPHGGGRRLEFESEPYQLLSRWIGQGLPRSSSDAAHLVRLLVAPQQHVMSQGELQQLAVMAEFSDGSRRDVTRQAQYASNLEVVATVDERGLVRCSSRTGEAAIMVRYMGQVGVFQVLVPQGQSLATLDGFEPRNYIDELAAAKWKKLGIRPSPPASDGEFLRRVTIDLCGRLPTIEETRTFLADSSADKRAKWIDQLLDSPDYASLFALRWGSILRNSGHSQGTAVAFHHWLRDQIARNRPYDEFVRSVVAVSGEPAEAPPVNRYWQMRDNLTHTATADTAQVFLGIRLQCAQCHHHPYEKWSQDDYYGLMGFFMRLSTKGGSQPFILYSASQVTRSERDPRNGAVPEPQFPGGQRVKVPDEVDPRQVLVDWMVRPDNPFFARALVNRLWGQLLGLGLVEPVDDMRLTNPSSNPALLDALAQDFVAHRYDVKHVLRTITNSAVYQLSSQPTEHNQADQQNFARYYAKRLMAEVMLDAVDQVCGTRTAFTGLPPKFRAVEVPHEKYASYFLDTFDRPRRVTACECERGTGANLSQVLLLSNSEEIESKLATSGRITQALAAKKPPREMVSEFYLAAFSRNPTDRELERALSYLSAQKDQRRALQDLLWVLVNSKEFSLNR